MGKVELYCLLFYMRGAPCTGVYGYSAFINCMFMPDSSSRVRGLDDLFRCFGLRSRFIVGLSRQPHCFPRGRNTQCFPFNEMMPRGPGILSVRDA